MREQLFLETELDKKHFAIWKNGIFANETKQLINMFNNCYNCHLFADILIEEKKLPIADFVAQEKLRSVLGNLIRCWSIAGTFEGYILFFRAVFGEQVNINFTNPSPAVLNINVSNINKEYYLWLTKGLIGNEVITDDNYNLEFQETIKNVSYTDILALLNSLTPVGFGVNVIIEN
jgi:hypothetical protein